MSTEKPLPGRFAGLTTNELEILRLLAAGHTAKTIAHRLGRTESAINERLRDARRKTGVGSSRELARLLDAQEVWDRKIDLSTSGSARETGPELATASSKLTKGVIVMGLALSAAAVAMVFAAPSPADLRAQRPDARLARQSEPALAGSWALDVSRIPEEERPGAVTMKFEVSQDGKWTTVVDIVGRDGSRQHAESTAATDGRPVAVSGTIPMINTVALRQPERDTLVMTLGHDGAPLSTRVYTVAKDRKSMTETIIWAGQQLPKLETTHFSRLP